MFIIVNQCAEHKILVDTLSIEQVISCSVKVLMKQCRDYGAYETRK